VRESRPPGSVRGAPGDGRLYRDSRLEREKWAARVTPQQLPPHTELRLDKWLWAARFFKSRSLASEAVEMGRVRLRGNRVKPAHPARVGDALEVIVGDMRLEVVVRALSARRGPASVARSLYEETAGSVTRREQAQLMRRHSPDPAQSIKGRPTKRQGRELRRLRGSESE